MAQKLSIAIITYNEEANIRRTLESVKWADEIVVVDSGSTDQTVRICREYTDKVFIQPWLGFSRQKNLAIDKTSGGWVLSLDADEPVEPELAEEIQTILPRPASLDGYRIPRKTFFLGRWMKHGGWYPDYNLRLFRKGKGRFEARIVHEAVKVVGAIGKTQNAILHYAYPDLDSYLVSINKYSSLTVEIMKERGISAFRASWMNIFFRPVFTFLYKYIIRLGFLDGKHGLVLNLFHAWYVFAKYAKAWEDTIRGQSPGARGKERTDV
jgi:glycosyltransferase involved in cell wall biosynthesis